MLAMTVWKNTEKTYDQISLHRRLTSFKGLSEMCWRKRKKKSRETNNLTNEKNIEDQKWWRKKMSILNNMYSFNFC